MKRKVSTKSKWMIVSSFLVSAALIATLALNIAAGSWETSAVFVIGLITLAVAAFVGTTVIRLRRSGYAKKLNESYFAEYEKIKDALSNSVMSRAEIKEVKQDVVSLMLDAQSQGRDAKEVVGETGAFIRRVQDSFGYRNRFLFQLLSVVQYGIFFIVIIQLLIFFEQGGQTGFFDITIGLSMFVMLMIMILAVYPVIRSAMRKDKSVLPFALPLGFGIGYIALLILLDTAVGRIGWVRVYLDSDIGMIGSWWLLAILAAAMLAAQGIKLGLRRRSIRRLKQGMDS
jgi:DNA-binding ferritin-like protein (Dps family)